MGTSLSISVITIALLTMADQAGRPPTLPGTTWAASFYHYHEDWTFVSADSVSIRSGQWGWSMPVDPKLIHEDSLCLGDPEMFRYRFDGTQLIVHGRYRANEEDTLTWDGERFRSNWMFTYGHVVLTQGGNADCRLHD